MMPPHIFMLAAIGVGLIAGYRMAHRALKSRETAHPPPQPRPVAEPRDLGSLVLDEATGEYRPRA